MENQELWNKIWIKSLIPKIIFNMWVLAHNNLTTIDNLKGKGFQIPNRCNLYMEDEK